MDSITAPEPTGGGDGLSECGRGSIGVS